MDTVSGNDSAFAPWTRHPFCVFLLSLLALFLGSLLVLFLIGAPWPAPVTAFDHSPSLNQYMGRNAPDIQRRWTQRDADSELPDPIRRFIKQFDPDSKLLETRPTPGDNATETVEQSLDHEKQAAPFSDMGDNASEPSRLEAIYRERYRADPAGKLEQFGYQLFQEQQKNPPRSMVPADDYVLGQGDIVRLRLWGPRHDEAYESEVSPAGDLDLPRFGVIQAGGVSLREAEELLRREAAKHTQGVRLDLSLVAPRDIEVYVVGEARRPGTRLLPAHSSVLDALLDADGVRKSGSLRRIGLQRGKTTTRVDLYELILAGSRDGDALLRDGDVIHIPRIGPTAAVAGAIAQEAIYELAGEETADDLLELAGGALPQGMLARAHIRRYTDNALSLSKAVLSGPNASPIHDGDLLLVHFINPDWPEAVYLAGHVREERVFPYTPGMRLSDVVSSPRLLLPEAITDYALLYRYDPYTTRFGVRTVSLRDALQAKGGETLRPHDTVAILSREDYGISEPVRLQGAVWNTGNFTYAPGMRLVDLLALGGGFRFGADRSSVELSRSIIRGGATRTEHQVVNFSTNPDLPLQPYDYVFVPQARNAREFRTATITGEVGRPGKYRIQDGERLSDLITRAGGFTSDAYFHGAVFTSQTVRELEQESLDQLVGQLELRAGQILTTQAQTADSGRESDSVRAARIGFESLMERIRDIQADGRVAIQLANLGVFRGSEQDFVLREGDSLHIPAMPNHVTVLGSVYSPSGHLYRPNMTIAEYLAKSGGTTSTADTERLYLLKANGEVVSKAQDSIFSQRFLDIKPMPGDTIVAPEDLERAPYMRIFKDLAEILFKIATTAGVAVAIM